MKFSIPAWQRIALPAMAIVLSIFYFGKFYVADELIYSNYAVEALQTDLQTALDQIEVEKTRTTIAKREVDVVRRANDMLRQSERLHQDEVAGLQADLAFYRRLGGANGSQAALAVHHMELQLTRSPRVYLLVFTLTQNLRWASSIAGRVELGVDGIQNGEAGHLNDRQLLAETADPLKFQFKYFQQFERLITLPEAFEAESLTIRLRSGSIGTAVEQTMQWQELFVQSATGDTAVPQVNVMPDD
jgi:hypothetical protein